MDLVYLPAHAKGVESGIGRPYSSYVESARPLDVLVARQRGVVSRSQARDLGMTRAQIQHRLTSGAWTRLATSVYAVASSPPTWERQLRAALLGNPESVAAGRSAANLLGIDGFRPSRPEILMPFDGNGRSDIARVIRSRHFDQISTKPVRDFVVTTVAETILTLSLREHPGTVERIIDSQLARRTLSIEDFHPILERLEYARQPGLPSLRRAIAMRSADFYQPPTTELERMLFRLLDHPDLPPYRAQAPFEYEALDATVDAYIETWRMIVEADGRRWHTRKADFERDRARDNAAASAGLIVIRFTYTMLKEDPETCVQTLLESGQWRANP